MPRTSSAPAPIVVWTPTDTTTVHAGFARYFSPPPFELVATRISRCSTTPRAASDHTDTTPKAERADYYDAGVVQNLFEGAQAGLDGFFKASHNLIDEGQFGAPIILTPFNYQAGRQYGGELTFNYRAGDFTGYVNAAYERADGQHIVSSEFQFAPGDLAYIANHYIPLDHQQIGTVSAGASYNFGEDVLFSAPTCSMAPGCAATERRRTAIMFPPIPSSISGSATGLRCRRLQGPDGAARSHQCFRRAL